MAFFKNAFARVLADFKSMHSFSPIGVRAFVAGVRNGLYVQILPVSYIYSHSLNLFTARLNTFSRSI